MDSDPSLGTTIRDRRLALGYSLGQLATKVDTTAASIRAWEKGDAVPSDQDLTALAGALDLGLETLEPLIDNHLFEEEEAAHVEVIDPWTEDAGGAPDSEPKDEAAGTVASDEGGQESTAVLVTDDEPADGEGEQDDHGDTASGDAVQDGTDGEEDPTEDAADDAAESSVVPARDGDSDIYEALTEAVPVVPPAAVATVSPESLEASLPTTSSEPMRRSDSPFFQAWELVESWYRRIFDPSRGWIYRVRFVLLLIAFYFMLRVFAWAVSELWDALGEVVDSISFSPSETPDVSN